MLHLHMLRLAAAAPTTTDGNGMVDAVGGYVADVGQSASKFLADIPPELGVMSMLAFLAGVTLWLAGAKVIKPVFAAGGLLLGGAIGFVTLPVFVTEPIGSIPSPYLGLAIGAILGLIASIVVLRFTIALGAAAVMAIASFMATGVYLEHYDPDDSSSTQSSLSSEDQLIPGIPVVDRFSDETIRTASQTEGDTAEDRRARAAANAERVRRFINEMSFEANAAWDHVPIKHRLMLAGSGIAGAVLGLLFGLVMPRKSAAVVTAMAGSAIWLTNITWIANALGIPGVDRMIVSPTARVIVWGVVSVMGMAWQIHSFQKKKRKSRDEDDDDDDEDDDY